MIDQSFCSNFLSNLLATLAGIVLGLPIALWLDRILRKRSENEKDLETKRRTIKILSLLDSELKGNLDALNNLQKDISINYFPVRTESWKAFSDGGELQWINDPDLINELSITYAELHQFTFLYQEYIESFYFPGMVGNLNLRDRLFESVRKIRDDASTQSKKTSVSIGKRLDNLNKIIASND